MQRLPVWWLQGAGATLYQPFCTSRFLDTWFEQAVKPKLKGKAFLVRYADDFVIGFEREDDARKVYEVLPQRFAKHGLTIHPEKTHLRRFGRPQGNDTENETFDFLGFTHYWGGTRYGGWAIKRKTMRKRIVRAAKRAWTWCRDHRHLNVAEQHKTLRRKLLGHYQYYAGRCNQRALKAVYNLTRYAWRYWLSRRSNDSALTWREYQRLLERFPLPQPVILHPW